MYEVNIRALSSTGDLPGVKGRLDEIHKLGVNVIWLMPIHPIGEINSVNSPYSVKNYKEVSPEFGSLADLEDLGYVIASLFQGLEFVETHGCRAWREGGPRHAL